MEKAQSTIYQFIYNNILYSLKVTHIKSYNGRDADDYECILFNEDENEQLNGDIVGIVGSCLGYLNRKSQNSVYFMDIAHLVVSRKFIDLCFDENKVVQKSDSILAPTLGIKDIDQLLNIPINFNTKIEIDIIEFILTMDRLNPVFDTIDIPSLLLSCSYHPMTIKNVLDYHSHSRGFYTLLDDVAIVKDRTKTLEMENHLRRLTGKSNTKIVHYFHEVKISFQKPYCFIIMPFKDEEFPQELYEDIVKPHIKKTYGIEAYDTRNNVIKSKIDNEIFTAITQSSFVIAELTNKNPNVMYELGLTHDLGKPTINLTQDDVTDLPFDIKLVHTDQYDISLTGTKKEKDILKILDKYIETYLKI